MPYVESINKPCIAGPKTVTIELGEKEVEALVFILGPRSQIDDANAGIIDTYHLYDVLSDVQREFED